MRISGSIYTFGCNFHYFNLVEQAFAPSNIIGHIREFHMFFRISATFLVKEGKSIWILSIIIDVFDIEQDWTIFKHEKFVLEFFCFSSDLVQIHIWN